MEQPQQKVFYRTGDEPGALDLEEWRGKGRSVVNHLASIVRVTCGFLGSACWSWRGRINQWWGGRKFGGTHLCGPLEMGERGEGRLQQVFCSRVGDETGGMAWGNGGRDGNLQLACLLSWQERPVGLQGGGSLF